MMVSRNEWKEHITSLKVPSFEKLYPTLVTAGKYAPSMHNTQPWIFKRHKNKVVISKNVDREIVHGDKRSHGFVIGMGAVIENISQVCDYFGYRVKVDHVDTTSVEVVFTKSKAKKSENHLVFSIPNRQTNRSLYLAKKNPKKFTETIKKLKGVVRIEGKKKDILGEIVKDADFASFSNKFFRSELATWIRHGKQHDNLGMNTHSMNFPPFLKPFISRLLPYLPVGKVAGKKDRELVKHTPTMLIIATKADTISSWIQAGRTYQYISLLASTFGMQTHPMYAPIHIDEYRDKLSNLFTKGLYPQFNLRVGFPSEERPHSSRLPIEKLMHEHI